MGKYYYQVLMDTVLKSENSNLGYVNISHIPYKKFEEIFADQITPEQRFVFYDIDSYLLTEEVYQKHKAYLDKQISVKFRFDIFEYWVGLVSIEADKYQKDYYEELPPLFEK